MLLLALLFAGALLDGVAFFDDELDEDGAGEALGWLGALLGALGRLGDWMRDGGACRDGVALGCRDGVALGACRDGVALGAGREGAALGRSGPLRDGGA